MLPSRRHPAEHVRLPGQSCPASSLQPAHGRQVTLSRTLSRPPPTFQSHRADKMSSSVASHTHPSAWRRADILFPSQRLPLACLLPSVLFLEDLDQNSTVRSHTLHTMYVIPVLQITDRGSEGLRNTLVVPPLVSICVGPGTKSIKVWNPCSSQFHVVTLGRPLQPLP